MVYPKHWLTTYSQNHLPNIFISDSGLELSLFKLFTKFQMRLLIQGLEFVMEQVLKGVLEQEQALEQV